MMSPGEAFERLRNGNARFVGSLESTSPSLETDRLPRLGAVQEPFAVVLGCSDSRVPVELVFDQGFGDLFVIRVAGNIVAPSQVGSVEFAAERFGTPLVVVLGHSQCGAVLATVEEMGRPASSTGPNLRSIVERIRPSVAPLMQRDGAPSEGLVGEAVRANVRISAQHLRAGSAILERRVAAGALLVVGAEYSLETGIVDFFDGAPAPRVGA